jgi:hypothetical protein
VTSRTQIITPTSGARHRDSSQAGCLRLCRGLAGASNRAAGQLWGFCGDLEDRGWCLRLLHFLASCVSAGRRADANDPIGWSGAGSNRRPSAFQAHSARLCLSPVVALRAVELRQPSLAVAHRRPVPAFVGSPFGSRTQAVQRQRSKKTVASLIAQLSQDEAAATALPTAETNAGAGRGDWLVLRSFGAVIAELLL